MGFLDQYDQQSWGFNRLAKAVGWVLLAGVIAYSIFWLFFRNWREERTTKEFLALLQQARYEQAYRKWGCTPEKPCRFYPYDDFLEDWGPDSPIGAVKSFSLGRSYTQTNGVIIEVEVNGKKQPNLWVEKGTEQIGFFPY